MRALLCLNKGSLYYLAAVAHVVHERASLVPETLAFPQRRFW